MTRIYISMGSNCERETHLRAGVDALQALLGPLTVSSVVESAAVGFVGAPFYNLVVSADTDLPLSHLCERLRTIEFAHGRPLDAKKCAPRTLDLDLLLYGDAMVTQPVILPRDEIMTSAFVLWPLAELAPTLRHPIAGCTMAELWRAFDPTLQPLTPIAFRWHR
jgi:2-amino-4-hydroxy-6-hydroxymethyldihydropteridine diphosphokinase